MTARLLAVVGALAVAGIAATTIRTNVATDSCGLLDPDCEPRAGTASCAQLGERDRNPRDRRVRPRLGSSSPASPQGRVQFGFNDDAYDAGQLGLLEGVTLHREAGSTLWREDLNWGRAEPEPGRYELSHWDAVYCGALSAEIRPIFHITGAPEWAADTSVECDEPCLHPPLPEHYQALRRFAEQVAIRYPQAAAIEAWNEPNLHQFWDRPDPERYVSVLRAIYRGVKDGNPDLPVLGGALSGIPRGNPGNGNLSLSRFLEGMYDAGAARFMDALSLHPYPVHPLSDPREIFTRSLRHAREIAAATDGPDRRRLWITEVGASTEDVPGSAQFTPQQQAATLLKIQRELARSEDVDAAVYHTLVEPNDDVASPPGFGWVIPEGEGFAPQPVYCQFAERFGTPARCPEDAPTP